MIKIDRVDQRVENILHNFIIVFQFHFSYFQQLNNTFFLKTIMNIFKSINKLYKKLNL